MENQNKIYLFWKFKLENQHSNSNWKTNIQNSNWKTNIRQGFGKPTFDKDLELTNIRQGFGKPTFNEDFIKLEK
jgi:hypothetical protein